MIWIRHVAHLGCKYNAHRFLVSKPEGNRLLQIPKPRRKNNIKMGIQEEEWVGVNWVHFTENRNESRIL
jgi:hypothetical protein